MSERVDLADVERHLAAALKGRPVDERERSLLGRECEDIPLLPEACAAVAQAIAELLLIELGHVLGDVRQAYESQPGTSDPDWTQAAHACAFIALRRAWVATHSSFKLAKTEGA